MQCENRASPSTRMGRAKTWLRARDVAGPASTLTGTAALTCATGTEAAKKPARMRTNAICCHDGAIEVSNAAAALPARQARMTGSLPTRLESEMSRGQPSIWAIEKPEMARPSCMGEAPRSVM
eukprot:1290013-Rhodomonas_salina.3